MTDEDLEEDLDGPGESEQQRQEREAEERALIAAYETVFLSPEGEMILRDMRSALDVFGVDSIMLGDEDLKEIPHPYRAYVALGLQKALRRMEAMVEYVQTERSAEVNDA